MTDAPQEPGDPDARAVPEFVPLTDQPPRRSRRALVAAALAVLVLAAAALAFALPGVRDDGATGPGAPSEAWSQWHPAASGEAAVTEIAARIGPRYRHTGGGQLVRVQGGPLKVAGLSLTVALRQPGGSGVSTLGGRHVLYRLCGRGPSCAIAGGAPSLERHLLLRREALELALYTLRYSGEVAGVVVFMPPRSGDRPSQALLFRRDQLARELGKPLSSTLTARTPTVARVRRSPDTLLVERITLPSLFRFRVAAARSGAPALLLLDPFVAPDASPAQPAGGSAGSLS